MILPVFALVAMLSPLAMAQETNDRDRDRGGERRERGPGGGGDDAERRQRMSNWMKEQLGATDEEMAVIQPKLEKLMLARRDSGGFGAFFGGRGGRDRDNDSETLSPAQQASRDLRQTLENKSATAEEIAAKLKALREARVKAREAVASAQKDLKEVLTQRQEAVLVNMGMLE
jgi:hypothetical protein